MRLAHLLRFVTLTIVAISLDACASPEPPRREVSIASSLETAREKGYEWEVSVLEDGTISAGEYEQAYDRYMDCQVALGYVFDKPKYLDPVEGQRWQALSEYRGAGDAPLDKMAECDSRIFLIEDPYVVTTPKVMDPQLMAKLRSCLDEKGIPYRGDEVNFNDFTSGLGDDAYRDSDSPYTSCLLDSAFELFPDLISVGYGR